jgi:hypothetical protein
MQWPPTSTLHWLEIELLTGEENLIGLMASNRETLGPALVANPLCPGAGGAYNARDRGPNRKFQLKTPFVYPVHFLEAGFWPARA